MLHMSIALHRAYPIERNFLSNFEKSAITRIKFSHIQYAKVKSEVMK